MLIHIINIRFNSSICLAVTLALFIPQLYGCADLKDSFQQLRQDIAIKNIKKGKIKNNTYLNDYYKISATGPKQWKPRLGYPKYLVKFISNDNISELELSTIETTNNINEIADNYLSSINTAKIVAKNKININGTNCTNIKYTSNRQDKVDKELMRSILIVCQCDSFISTIEASTLDQLYEENVGHFNQFINSFTINNRERAGVQDASNLSIINERTEDQDLQYVVRGGDTLDSIASKTTGDSKNWQKIAQYNQITNPLSLKVNQKILIPRSLIDGSGIYKSNHGISENSSNQVKSEEAITPSTHETEMADESPAQNTQVDEDEARPSERTSVTGKESPRQHGGVMIVKSAHDNINIQTIQVMSGPGPYPLYNVIGKAPLGKTFDYIETEGNYVKILFNDTEGYVFIKNVEFNK